MWRGPPSPTGAPISHSGTPLARSSRTRTLPPYSPAWGQPGLPPWRLALITIMQFREQLSDRQAAEAVRARIDWKYLLGLELSDPGLHFSVLSEFRDRLLAGSAEVLLLDKLLERCLLACASGLSSIEYPTSRNPTT